MKLTDIHIERFGVWKNLDLALNRSGINVFFGPNEAGKSTLLRFVRGVLYGFQPLKWEFAAKDQPQPAWRGLLGVEHEGSACDVLRSTDGLGREELVVAGLDESQPASKMLAKLLCGTDRTVFENVFAVGLHELQELATLHDDDVADHIYGLTLGPEGQRLLDAASHLEHQSAALYDAESNGELAELLKHEAALTAEFEVQSASRRIYTERRRQLENLERRIADLKARQSGMQSQLRGHLFLERVHAPWSQVRDYEDQLDAIPEVTTFPEHGLARLAEIEGELATAIRCRDALKAEVADFRRQGEALKLDSAIREHAASIRGLLDQREFFARLGDKLERQQAETDEAQSQLDAQIKLLGPDWSAERLRGVQSAPGAQVKLFATARAYEAALGRRARLRSKYRRLVKAHRRQSAEHRQNLQSLGGLPLCEAVSAEQRKLKDLESLGRLRLRETELEGKLEDLRLQAAQAEARSALPAWVYVVWGGFGAAGIMLTALGLRTGITTSLLGGLGYAFLGVTCAIMAWGLKTHHSRSVDQEDPADELDRLETALRETREALARLSGDKPQRLALAAGTTSGAGAQLQRSADELIAACVRKLARLHLWSELEPRIAAERKRLSELRRRFQEVQKDVSDTRQRWCAELTAAGLPETVRVDEAFATWQQVAGAREAERSWTRACAALAEDRPLYATFQNRIAQLAEKIGSAQYDPAAPLAVLGKWEQQLDEFRRNRSQLRRLRHEMQRRRREAAGYQNRVAALIAERGALFAQGGASGREEFERRAAWVRERAELEEYLAIARMELETAARTEPNLAIVEEDLDRFDADENSQCIAALNLELEALDGDQHAAHEELGSLKQELRALEHSGTATELRFDLAQNNWRLKRAGERWFAIARARDAVDQIRTRFERTCQPAVLASASRYLERLTRGRYANVWTPLGQRRLAIDDAQGRTLSPEQLSGGTREQLFLAVRLALVREFSRRGIELPIVLDDILVNFDQPRTEAAIETLLEFAGEGQQILFFTCHLHLARLFESRGADTIWLPGHVPPVEERRAG